MNQVLLSLAVLACPVGMGLMMFFMGRGMLGAKKRDEAKAGSADDLGALKAEAARLDARIVELQSRPIADPAER